MRRIVPIALLAIACALSVPTTRLTATDFQTARDNSSPKVRLLKVGARALAKLPAGKKYIVDLTREGTIYEFDPAAGAIDFKRVVIRTADGEEAIGSWVEKFPKKAWAGWESKGLRVGATADFRRERGLPPTIQTPPPNPSAFECNRRRCSCVGVIDCMDLISSGLCGERLFCFWGGDFCGCDRKQA